MNEAIDVFRVLTGLVWGLVLIFLSGSMWRALHGRQRGLDRSWVLVCFFALHQIGFTARWWNDWSVNPSPGNDQLSLLGLNILSVLIGTMVLWRRWAYGERSW